MTGKIKSRRLAAKSRGWLAIVSALALTMTARAQVAFGSFPNNSTHSSASVVAAIANVPTNCGVVYDPIGQTNFLQAYNYGTLVYKGPIDVSQTLQRIRLGYYMTKETDDGGFFNFTGNELPNIPRKGNNYYMEFMVWPFLNLTNGTYNTTEEAYNVVKYPGAERLLIGLGGEVWYTGDHYGEDGPQQNAENVDPLPPSGVFSVTNIVVKGTNTVLHWNTIGGQTNYVQATTGLASNFTDISPAIIAGGGDLTNASYTDLGGATNLPARFYRVRLMQ